MKTVSCYYSNDLSEYVECYCDTKAPCFMTHFCEQSKKNQFCGFFCHYTHQHSLRIYCLATTNHLS